MLIHGIHPVKEALASGGVTTLWVGGRRDRRVQDLIDRARRSGATVREVAPAELDGLVPGETHQGVVARVRRASSHSIDELVRAASTPLLLVLDGIEDPQNFGAMARSADAAGVDGVIVQTRRAAPVSAAAVKASAGALSHVPIAPVVNIARALTELAELGVWTVGLDADADQRYDGVDLCQPVALVVGAEGRGLRRLVRERCDWLVSIPMAGRVESLNASVATGVVLFEAARQRRVSAGEHRPLPHRSGRGGAAGGRGR